MTGGVGMHLPRLRKRGDGVSPLRGHNGHICSICFRRPLSLLALFGHHFILGYSDGFIAFAVFANNTGCLHSLMHQLEQFFSGGVLDDNVLLILLAGAGYNGADHIVVIIPSRCIYCSMTVASSAANTFVVHATESSIRAKSPKIRNLSFCFIVDYLIVN